MYTRAIVFKRLVHDVWVEQKLPVTTDSLWLHYNSLILRSDVKSIEVVDVTV